MNYNLFSPDQLAGTSKYYIIPNAIDTIKLVKIHIAEGPFDILSIFYNLNNGNKYNNRNQGYKRQQKRALQHCDGNL